MILTFQYSSVLILHHFTFRQARNNFSEDSFIQCTYFLYSSLSHPLLQVEPLYRIYIQIRTINECILLERKKCSIFPNRYIFSRQEYKHIEHPFRYVQASMLHF